VTSSPGNSLICTYPHNCICNTNDDRRDDLHAQIMNNRNAPCMYQSWLEPSTHNTLSDANCTELDLNILGTHCLLQILPGEHKHNPLMLVPEIDDGLCVCTGIRKENSEVDNVRNKILSLLRQCAK